MKNEDARVDPEIEQVWKEEADRSLNEIENEEAETIPGPQVMDELSKIAKEWR